MTREEAFSFPSADGKTQIHAVKWIPESGEYRAILQISHGMIEYIERYRPFAEYLNERGFLVVGHDHLGHGGSVASENDYGYMAEGNPSDTLVADMHKLRTLIQKENPGVPYFMAAHSMGSYMLRKYLTIHNQNLSGAVVMGTGMVADAVMKFGMFLCKFYAKRHGWHYISDFIIKLSFAGSYKKFDVTGENAGNSWLTRDVESVKAYYADSKCSFKFTVNGYYGLMQAVYYDNQQENANKIPKDLPMLIVSGDQDPVGDLGVGVSKVCAMYQKAGIKDLTCKLYKDARHELLNETNKAEIFEDIYTWLDERV